MGKLLKRMETHSHSCYSNLRLLDAINTIDDIILVPAELGLSGVCLTDHECLSGAIDFLKKEKEYKQKGKIPWDFKCAIGNEIYLTDTREKSQKYYHFILIAKDEIGFRQLCEISSKSWYHSYYDRGMERVPTLKKELEEIIKKNKGHIIASTACLAGQLPSLILQYRKNKSEETKEKINDFVLWGKEVFGEDFYLETAPNTNPEQIIVNKTILSLSRVFNIKMIYGTDAHYQTKDKRFVHKAYLNSKEGEREVDSFYEFSHFMDNDEAWGYFQSSYDDYDIFEEMCNNSMEIYEKIGSYEEIFKQPIIPHTEVKNYPKKKMNTGSAILDRLFFSTNQQERYWINECWNSLEEKGLVNEKYINRLAVEANTIEVIGKKLENCLFEYFNTFKSFIDLFWECGSIVGPGRGSAVCFLSNYLLGITQLNPIEWNLAEWRFLNEERVELPKRS